MLFEIKSFFILVIDSELEESIDKNLFPALEGLKIILATSLADIFLPNKSGTMTVFLTQ